MNNKMPKNLKVSYESEADVMSWEVSSQPIDYAEEAGNFVVHYSKNHIPVLVEILEASSFFQKSQKLLARQRQTA
ncbi:MAG: DUF2283 domain-containing protein [Candidatus Vogelbacteria bacterium]